MCVYVYIYIYMTLRGDPIIVPHSTLRGFRVWGVGRRISGFKFPESPIPLSEVLGFRSRLKGFRLQGLGMIEVERVWLVLKSSGKTG